jgi:hypothetical protein
VHGVLLGLFGRRLVVVECVAQPAQGDLVERLDEAVVTDGLGFPGRRTKGL